MSSCFLIRKKSMGSDRTNMLILETMNIEGGSRHYALCFTSSSLSRSPFPGLWWRVVQHDHIISRIIPPFVPFLRLWIGSLPHDITPNVLASTSQRILCSLAYLALS